VALPKVLFLDEPTSGLDSTSSAVLARQLKDIAIRRGVTIASVIHQPSIQAFFEFDDLLLLGKGGQVVYHGPISEASAYFESIGFKPVGLTNPADFYLDIANGAVARDGDPDFIPPHLFQFWENKVSVGPASGPDNLLCLSVSLSVSLTFPPETWETLQLRRGVRYRGQLEEPHEGEPGPQ
jgi:energy-coupling factor transporter ATP-binding protein EcfA2